MSLGREDFGALSTPLSVTDLPSLSRPSPPFTGLDAPGNASAGRAGTTGVSPSGNWAPRRSPASSARDPPFQFLCLDAPKLCSDAQSRFFQLLLNPLPTRRPTVYCLKSATDEAALGGSEDWWWSFPGNKP